MSYFIFSDLTKYLVCDTGFNVSIPDLNFPPNFVFSGVENRDNGTFCKMAADGNGNDSETDVLGEREHNFYSFFKINFFYFQFSASQFT